ncbi:hypothetical protein PC129_g17700 [Phytophthora cactorum]|uniref:Uncharacterized protein n=3 Tax=Phytophthora cactorum TaxID=29920 RepID=A0A8T1HGZ1_9STRA|nr:hypothetical protein Pcac1_g27461 [Phytophthora cactorum]KAG3003989.1 hypothetical protein PC119_g15758 [Phytophthora cactorum]KAG3137304.1 hypothetical protein C6341_g21040 [Phytophthora cactorum]KAG3211327.1 hypothetical protein PC129_g17700 [Phytophthora cactorum]
MSPRRTGKSCPQQPTPSRSRRPRDDELSASSWKRSRNEEEEKVPTPVKFSSPRPVATERAPWMPTATEIASKFGATSTPNQTPLYVCSANNGDAEAAAQHFDPMTIQRRDYYIGLFHELRWYASKRTSRKSKVPEWVALCQSSSAFVENFNKGAKAYRARITAAQRRFETFSRRHMIDRLHNEAMEGDIPCAVPFGIACSHCPPGSLRFFERDITGYTTVRVPVQLRDLRVQLERRDERRDTPSVSGDRSTRAGVTPAPRVGLRTPSPFPERPDGGSFAVPIYLDGEEILSTNTKTSLISVRLLGFIAHDSPHYSASRVARIAQCWRQWLRVGLIPLCRIYLGNASSCTDQGEPVNHFSSRLSSPACVVPGASL